MPWINGTWYEPENVPMAQNINFQRDVIKEDDGLSCLRYGLRVKYQSLAQDKTASGTKTTIVLQGTYDACKKAAFGAEGIEPIFKINSSHQTYGTLEQMRLTQDEGPLWNLELTYSTETNWLGISNAKGSSYGKTASELNARMISKPLEEHPRYRMRWNLGFYCTAPKSYFKNAEGNPEIPGDDSTYNKIYEGWKQAGNYWDSGDKRYELHDPFKDLAYTGPDSDGTTETLHQCFAWAKSRSELPDLSRSKHFKGWYLWYEMQKPGVEYYERPVYELTETSKQTSMNRTAWNVSAKLGKIADPSEGDFGVEKALGGNWLCEAASTRFDGKYWLTTFTFLHSGGKHGWDEDLYKTYDEDLNMDGTHKD